MKCSQIFRSVRKGFSKAKKDRIEEWSGLKTRGFWLGWFKVNASWPIIFSLVHMGFAAFKGEPSMIRAAGQGFCVGALFMLCMALVDAVIWYMREREWRKSQSN